MASGAGALRQSVRRAPKAARNLLSLSSVTRFDTLSHSFPHAVAAIVCTRSETELAGIFGSLSELGGIEFYSFNTLGQILRHLLLKVGVSEGGLPHPEA